LNLRGNQVFSGSGTSNCLYTIKGNLVYKGAGTSTALYNISRRAIYKGSSVSKMEANWTGSQLSTIDIACLVWLLQYNT
jgi:hypothetical protein